MLRELRVQDNFRGLVASPSEVVCCVLLVTQHLDKSISLAGGTFFSFRRGNSVIPGNMRLWQGGGGELSDVLFFHF